MSDVWELTIRNVMARKRRVVLTAVAVVLGVAFIGATQTLGATVDRSLTTSAGDFYSQLAAQVRGPEVGDLGERATVPTALGDDIASVDGVDDVIDIVLEPVTVVKSDGKVLPTPVTAGTWFDSPAQPLSVVEGQAPAATGEVALTEQLAEDTGFGVGDEVRFESSVGATTATVTAVVAAESSSVSGVPSLVLGPDDAGLLLPAGQATQLGVVGDDVDVAAVRAAAEASGTPVDVRSGTAAAEEAVDDASQAASVLTTTFGAFGALALFVGLFIIYNTFNILMAQRRREMALLRAIGVRRKQVMRSILGEAAAIGLVAGLLGAALGLAIAAVGRSLLLGDIDGPLVIEPSTLITGVLIGLIATVASAWVPARRASKVAPIEALRDAGTDTSSRSISRLIGAVVLTALTAVILVAAFAPEAENAAALVGMAAFLGLIALIVALPLVAKPLVTVFGAPVRKLRGHIGALATENAKRQPHRTASTATALLIGVTIVGFALVITASLRASVTSAIKDRVSAEYVVTPVSFGTSLSPDAVAAAEGAAGDAPTAEAWTVSASIDGAASAVFAVDSRGGADLWDFRPEGGTLADLGTDGILVDRHVADDEGWKVGDTLSVAYPSGTSGDMVIEAIGDTRPFGADYVIDDEDILTREPTATLTQLLVGQGADRGALEASLADFPNAEVTTPDEMAKELDSAISILLQVLLGFLGLSVLIAFIGVANTMALSIHERTRELGVLRAIALRRSHVRSAVRWEAAIISGLGAAVGIVFGGGFGAALAKVLEDTGFSRLTVPWGQLAIVVVGASLAGALAAALPARRAAKLDILEAIHEL